MQRNASALLVPRAGHTHNYVTWHWRMHCSGLC